MVPLTTGVGRLANATTAIITMTTAAAMRTGTMGGKVHLALSNSSPIGMWPGVYCGAGAELCCPELGCGAGAGGGGVGFSGIYQAPQHSKHTPVRCRNGRRSCLQQHGLAAPHGLGEVRNRKSVQQIILRQPCTAKLQHPIPDLLQVRSVVRVSIDDELHSPRLRHPQ